MQKVCAIKRDRAASVRRCTTSQAPIAMRGPSTNELSSWNQEISHDNDGEQACNSSRNVDKNWGRKFVHSLKYRAKKKRLWLCTAFQTCKVAQRKLKIGFQHEIHKIGSLAHDYHHPFVLLRNGRRQPNRRPLGRRVARRVAPSARSECHRKHLSLGQVSGWPRPRLPTRNEFGTPFDNKLVQCATPWTQRVTKQKHKYNINNNTKPVKFALFKRFQKVKKKKIRSEI